jgi:hypothetical protein
MGHVNYTAKFVIEKYFKSENFNLIGQELITKIRAVVEIRQIVNKIKIKIKNPTLFGWSQTSPLKDPYLKENAP